MEQWMTKDEVIQLAEKLVSIESHKAFAKQESKIAGFIQELLEKEGIPTEMEEVEPLRPNVYGFLSGKEDEHYLMFNGHTDTVPAFNMDYPPFKPFIKDGKLFGRGSVDMKGAIAAMLSAIIAVKRKGDVLKKGVVFAGVIDEEQACKGTEQIVRSGIMKPKLAIIGEPTNLETAIAHKGMEWIEVTFKGRATHGSRPKEGINAIYLANEFLSRLKNELEPKIDQKTYPLLGAGTINPGVIKGGDDPNIVPDRCVVQMDRRWLPSETVKSVYGEIEDLAKAVIEKRGGDYSIRRMDEETAALYNMPHSIDPDHILVTEALRITEEITKVKGEPVAFPGWSDGAQLSNNIGTEAIVLGPGDISQAHSNDEFCSTEQIWQATQIYFEMIQSLCM